MERIWSKVEYYYPKSKFLRLGKVKDSISILEFYRFCKIAGLRSIPPPGIILINHADYQFGVLDFSLISDGRFLCSTNCSIKEA